MNQAEADEAYEQYLSLRDQANVDWRRLADITALVAEQFMDDQPHSGDLNAVSRTFITATQKTREAVAHYRDWLALRQGGTE